MGERDRQTTDEQTDARQLHRPCSEYYAGGANNPDTGNSASHGTLEQVLQKSPDA